MESLLQPSIRSLSSNSLAIQAGAKAGTFGRKKAYEKSNSGFDRVRVDLLRSRGP